uniref:Integron gene cassette protein n=1 Tax=Macrostomum lignano TaxID=282301 RepID=A0A1I8FA94_9PLAT
ALSRSRTNYSNSLCRARISLVQGVWTASSAWHFGGRSGSWRASCCRLASSNLLPACLGIMLTLRLRQADLLQQSDESQAAALLGSSSRRRGSAVDVELRLNWQSQAKQVFCTALQRLYRGAITEAHKGLVFNYLGGRFHGGDSAGRDPCSVRTCCSACATDYVDLLLASPRTFCCHLCRDSHGRPALGSPSCSSGPVRIISSLWPERGDRLRRRLPNGCTPQVSMLVCALFNAAFLCLLGFYVYETTIMMDVIPFLIVNAFFLASFGILIVCPAVSQRAHLRA